MFTPRGARERTSTNAQIVLELLNARTRIDEKTRRVILSERLARQCGIGLLTCWRYECSIIHDST